MAISNLYKIPTVVPAQAGTHKPVASGTVLWIPACAGMTGLVL